MGVLVPGTEGSETSSTTSQKPFLHGTFQPHPKAYHEELDAPRIQSMHIKDTPAEENPPCCYTCCSISCCYCCKPCFDECSNHCCCCQWKTPSKKLGQ